jgi:hypothetical protein
METLNVALEFAEKTIDQSAISQDKCRFMTKIASCGVAEIAEK